MASTAVPTFRSLLMEVSRQMTAKDVREMAYLLEFDASSEFGSGVELFQALQRKDQLDEDNLAKLTGALKDLNLLKALKSIQRFEAARKAPGKSEDLSQSWPSSNFASQPHKPRTSSDTSSQAYTMATGNYAWDRDGVPPVNYHGYSRPEHVNGQQGAPQPAPWGQHPPGGGPEWGGQTHPTLYPQGLVFDSRYPPGSQQQQQYAGLKGVAALGAQHGYSGAQPRAQPGAPGHSRLQSYPGTTSGGPPPTAALGVRGHGRLSAVKSAPNSVGAPGPEDVSLVALVAIPELEAGLVKGPPPTTDVPTKAMNIPPENKEENVVTATGPQPGNSMMSRTGGHSPADGNCGTTKGGRTVNVTNTYQTGRVRVNSVEENNSVAVPTQPMSARSEADPEVLLISGITGKELYDCHKVDCIVNGPYQVRIPEGTHYLTSEGAFVPLKFGSDYRIQLYNNDKRLRCSALVSYDGKFAGEWTIDGGGTVTLERPAVEERKFHFVPASRAPPGSGVAEVDPDSGLISVEFTPEQVESDPWNDLSRGLGTASSGQPQEDYFGCYDPGDVQRNCLPPPDQSWQLGSSILKGESGQMFSVSEPFRVDERLKKTILLRLVGK